MEKAHPGVQEIFYQVFDKGTLRDGEGRDIDFRHTTIIMTANAGTETLSALVSDPATMPEASALADLVRPELLRHFRPAFLGRLTIVPYLPLGAAELRDIARLQLGAVIDRLFDAHRIELSVEPAVEERIVARSLVADIGARAIEGILNREILPLLSTFVLERVLGQGVPRRLFLTSGHDGFRVEAEPAGRTRASARAPAHAEAAVDSS
jgi:type VI secretion system protein VasG